jgi:WD40 repeat protein
LRSDDREREPVGAVRDGDGGHDRFLSRAKQSAFVGGEVGVVQGDYFAKYVWKSAGVTDLGGLDSWAYSFWRYGLNKGTWHAAGSGYTPQPGDAVVFDWDPPFDSSYFEDIDHVGIVESFSAGTLTTIEGNTSDGTHRRDRSSSLSNGEVIGFTSPVGALPVDGAAQSSGAVVYNGVLYEFARGADGTLKYWFANGGPWSATQTIGGSVSGAVSATVFNGVLYVFARGTDGSVDYWFANGGPWSATQTIIASASGGLSATVFNGVLYVFARGTDGSVKYWFANGGPWSATQTIGGSVTGAIASTGFNGILYVFARGTDGSIDYWFANGGPWSAAQIIPNSQT